MNPDSKPEGEVGTASREQLRQSIEEELEEYPYDGGERYCYACGGRGWRVTCIDDLCYGQDECIHGDPPTPCRECNPKGDRFDEY